MQSYLLLHADILEGGQNTTAPLVQTLFRMQMKALLSNNSSKDTVQTWNIYCNLSNLKTDLTSVNEGSTILNRLDCTNYREIDTYPRIPSSYATSPSPLSPLKTHIESLPTQIAIASAIQTLIRMLLLHTAALTHSSHLLLETSLTSLSVSLISSISQGGGYSVREEAQEEWTYLNQNDIQQTVRVVRPLRDVGTKECVSRAWWCDLKIAGKHRYSGGRQDISAITRDFIMGLITCFNHRMYM